MWGGGEASEFGEADEFKSVAVAWRMDGGGVDGLDVIDLALIAVGITMPPPFGPTAIDGRTTARLYEFGAILNGKITKFIAKI